MEIICPWWPPHFWSYQTFYVMWAKFPLPENVLEPPQYFGLNYLGSYLMRGAGLPMTGYQKFLLKSAKYLPVAMPVGFKANPQAWASDFYIWQAALQYNLLYDTDHYPPSFYTLSSESAGE